MKKILSFAILFLSMGLPLLVRANDHEEGHSHKAHVHGAGNASIAFEKGQGQLLFEAPSESVYGFEYLPKKAKDIAARDEAFKRLESEISRTFQFEEKLGCKWAKIKIENEFEPKEKDHSSVLAEFKISCSTSPLGKNLKINLKSAFPKLKKLKLDILLDDFQKSFNLEKSEEEILLKE